MHFFALCDLLGWVASWVWRMCLQVLGWCQLGILEHYTFDSCYRIILKG
jgi:hypothetical protein